MANQIQLKGNFRHEEPLASGTITPGHLVEKTTATADTVIVHATEGGYAERMVAVEDALQGNTLDDDYSDGARVMVHVVATGAEVQMFLAAGESADEGDELISAGDGTLIVNGSEDSTTTVEQIIAYAMEALDLSASGTSATLMDVRIA